MFFFLMIRRPPRSTLDRSSAASDVYKRQLPDRSKLASRVKRPVAAAAAVKEFSGFCGTGSETVSYTHLRAHETVLDIVCRLLLEKKKITHINDMKQVTA